MELVGEQTYCPAIWPPKLTIFSTHHEATGFTFLSIQQELSESGKKFRDSQHSKITKHKHWYVGARSCCSQDFKETQQEPTVGLHCSLGILSLGNTLLSHKQESREFSLFFIIEEAVTATLFITQYSPCPPPRLSLFLSPPPWLPKREADSEIRLECGHLWETGLTSLEWEGVRENWLSWEHYARFKTWGCLGVNVHT